MIDILIPTFNRSEFLKTNLDLIADQIRNDELMDSFRVLVSDNSSTDGTWDVIGAISGDYPVTLHMYRQQMNVGLEPNAIFLLRESNSEYVMYLGDDDYLPNGYLKFVKECIEAETPACIIPGFTALYQDGSMKRIRSEDFSIKAYSPGFRTLKRLSNYGHQLSGLVLRREGLYHTYTKNEQLRNMYPFVFFCAYATMRGKTYYAPAFQVRVTQGNRKDWTYDDAGLLTDIFKNYRILFPHEKLREAWACAIFARKQYWRLRISANPRSPYRAFRYIASDRSASALTKAAIGLLCVELYCRSVALYIFRRIQLN